MSGFALAVHGGCGVMPMSELSPEGWAVARNDLVTALKAGWAILNAGGSSLDAVEQAVIVLEDSPVFNAGHGATLNAAGDHELDAAIMSGADLRAGAIAAARRIRNPVRAARAVLESGSLVMLTGAGADEFAGAAGLDLVDPDYFTTDERRRNLRSMRDRALDGTLAAASEAEKHGTVGAVALDRAGHLAAATSTGGYTNKPAGRIGDSPIIGAGTYARDGICAVSGTGQGEFFIRHVLAHDIACRIAYRKDDLQTAAAGVIDDLAPYRIGAGLIAIDATGEITAPHNTEGMFRGWITRDGELSVATHGEVHWVERLAASI